MSTMKHELGLSLSDAEAGFQVRHNGEQEADACTKMPVGSMEVPGDSSAGLRRGIHVSKRQADNPPR